MKLTILEYCDLFYGANGYKHRDEVQKKCRYGELKATQKNKNGKWFIDVDVPEDVLKAWREVQQKVAYRDALFNEVRKTNDEIAKLNETVFGFTNRL